MKYYCVILSLLLFVNGCRDVGKSADVLPNKNGSSKISRITQAVGIGQIVPEKDIIQLSSPVNGIVQKIYKNENDSVKQGEKILELEHSVEDAKINQVYKEISTQTSQIKLDETSINDFRIKAQNADREVQRLKRLLGKGAETQQVVDNAITSLESLEANIQRLQAGVEVSKSKLAEIKVALNLAQTERDQKIIKSPVSGKILEVSTNIGSSLDTRQSFAQINPQGKTIAVCEIDELFADKVVVGQKAWIRNLGSQDTLSTGLVSFTSSFLKKKSLFTDQAGEKEDRRVREIKILIDQPEKLLINARVECVIELTAAIKN